MSVFVRFGRRKAFLRRGVWLAADPELEGSLNRATEDWISETGGPPITDPDHDYTLALRIAGQLGGRVAGRTQPASKRVPEFYISRRQLKLF